jgi:hypothetical protein
MTLFRDSRASYVCILNEVFGPAPMLVSINMWILFTIIIIYIYIYKTMVMQVPDWRQGICSGIFIVHRPCSENDDI